MTPEDFQAKWRNVTATERQASQEHFRDLCRLLGVPNPLEGDPTGTDYCFEKNVLKLDGRPGRADVWKRGCFAWEYKSHHKNLTRAYSQLKEYADALQNPPLLIVSDMREIRVHTNFTNAIAEQHVFLLADLNAPSVRERLTWCFTGPERWRPTKTRETVTAEAAGKFGQMADRLMRQGGYSRQRVAHFLNKLVFCLFAEDIELLPGRVFADILEEAIKRPDEFALMLADLFRAMRDRNGRFGTLSIPWFDGGLFDDDDTLPLGHLETRDLVAAARLDWSRIEPSIFGTLFEQGLDPKRRKEMASLFDPVAAKPGAPQHKGVGIHYTDPGTIMKLIEPVVLRPLRREWEAVKARVEAARAKADAANTDAARTRHRNEAGDAYLVFRARLGRFRVLDPACGSGNFLYLSLLHLKDFDLAVQTEARALGLPDDDPRIGPHAVLGIEINDYAAELARVTIWIGELQWQLKNGFGIHRQPILAQLPGIECRDALINADGSEAEWPAADAIVGNPPFLGNKKMISSLGGDYATRLRKAYEGRVPGGADLVMFWFEKARAGLEAVQVSCAGLVATNSIRAGDNRKVLERIRGTGGIFEAWSDEPWVVEGASLRVSLVCFTASSLAGCYLDGQPVLEIHSDLSGRDAGRGSDLTHAQRLPANCDKAFQGPVKVGPFDIPGDVARKYLQMPINPNGRHNSDVVKPWANGMDVTRRPSDTWIIDFAERTETDACLYEAPFEYVLMHAKPFRDQNRRNRRREKWWQHGETVPGLRSATSGISRYALTPRVAKYRLFVWKPAIVLPDSRLVAIARDDDTTFGILHSRFHELWSLRLGGWHGGERPQYTPSAGFETFPFPEGLTPDIPAAGYAADPRAVRIAEAARRLNDLREAWLNPADLVRREPEVVADYPDRILPVSEAAAAILKKRTLTNLYNERPAWLDHAHRDLDAAVADAYGWPADLSDDEILKRLLALNLARTATEGG